MSEVDAVANVWTVVGTALSTIGVIVAALIARRGSEHSRRAQEAAEAAHHQVTANHHESATPTIPDRLDDLETAVSTLVGSVLRLREQHDQDTNELREQLQELTPPPRLRAALPWPRRRRHESS